MESITVVDLSPLAGLVSNPPFIPGAYAPGYCSFTPPGFVSRTHFIPRVYTPGYCFFAPSGLTVFNTPTVESITVVDLSPLSGLGIGIEIAVGSRSRQTETVN